MQLIEDQLLAMESLDGFAQGRARAQQLEEAKRKFAIRVAQLEDGESINRKHIE
jgi:hypothetical protein